MRGRHVTTAVTLVVLVALLVLGGYYGAKALFAPIPNQSASSTPSPTCKTVAVKKGQKLRASEVQVSVFNAGTTPGLAQATLAKLHKRGFRKGDIGNAPSNVTVKRAQVWTTDRHDPAARLVAKQLGGGAKVKFVNTNLGPGVDVVVGNNFHHLAKVKNFIIVKHSASACLR